MRSFALPRGLALRLENHRLHREIVGLVCRLRAVELERDAARRDCELLALMARDRRVALEFVAESHAIRSLDEAL